MDDPNLAESLRRKGNVYTSPEIQNEIIKVMGLHILRDVSADLQATPFLTVMADETTDSSNREQVSLRSMKNFLAYITLPLLMLPCSQQQSKTSLSK